MGAHRAWKITASAKRVETPRGFSAVVSAKRHQRLARAAARMADARMALVKAVSAATTMGKTSCVKTATARKVVHATSVIQANHF